MMAPTAEAALPPPAFTQVRDERVAPHQKVGAPYEANGTWYVPAAEPDYDETGAASWYGGDFHGRPTANGERFDMNVPSAAHPTLPIPSLVEVTNLENGRAMMVRVNDRGPFVGGRLIDLSARAAELLGFREQGSAQVRVRYVGPAPELAPEGARMMTAQRADPPPAQSRPRADAPRRPWQAPRPQADTARSVEATGPVVQAGVFSRRANAERALAMAAPAGPARLIEEAGAGGTNWRVVVGPMRDAAAAGAAVETLSEAGLPGARVLASTR